MNWFKKRSKEPTTYIGFGLLAQAFMMLTKADPAHMEAVGQTFEHVAQPLASGDYTAAATMLLTGILGVFMSEKGK